MEISTQVIGEVNTRFIHVILMYLSRGYIPNGASQINTLFNYTPQRTERTG